MKTTEGQTKFEKIISAYGKTSMKDVLVSKLLELLKDGNLKNDDVYDDEDTDVTDKIFVNFPNYGTRTHTIILVDDNNKVYYEEHTLSFPVDTTSPSWTSQNYEFDLI